MVGGGGTAAYSQAAIADALVAEGTPLSDDDAFKEALGKLPADALVKAYVDGPGLDAAVWSAAQKQPASGLGTSSLGLDTLKYVAASISAEHDGIRVHGASSGGSLGGGEFASKLIGSVPGDALAFRDFRGEDTAKQLDRLKASPQTGAALEQIQATLGVPLDEVLALLHGEVAFYVRPSVGIPELTLALQESDVSSALETLDKIAAHLVKTMHAHVGAGTQDGHPVKRISFGQFAVHYGAVGDTVVITSGVNGIAGFGGSGDRLPDSADFKEGKDAAGMPDSTGAVVYIDLKDALPLIEGFATLSGHGLSSKATENLRPLRSFLAWSEGGAGARTYDAFLEIK